MCLYRKQNGKSLSAMISGCPDIKIVYYESLPEAKDILDRYFDNI